MTTDRWISVGDELSPDGRQVDVYSPEWGEVFCDCRRVDLWFDETNYLAVAKGAEIKEVAY